MCKSRDVSHAGRRHPRAAPLRPLTRQFVAGNVRSGDGRLSSRLPQGDSNNHELSRGKQHVTRTRDLSGREIALGQARKD
jgi:hypothetical protein